MVEYWLSHNRAFWDEGNTSKKFTGTIHTDEARTNELDLSDKEVRVLIREDYPVTELMSKVVTITRTNSIEFTFTESEIPEIDIRECFTHPKVLRGMKERFPLIEDYPWVKV